MSHLFTCGPEREGGAYITSGFPCRARRWYCGETGRMSFTTMPAYRAPPARPKTPSHRKESEAHMRPLIVVVLLLLSAGCSIKRVAVDKLGTALASGGSTFTR